MRKNFSIRLDNNSAAEYLGYAPDTLRKSRCSGALAGVSAPVFIKVGKRKVVYVLDDLDRWLMQFPERRNTAESALWNQG